MRKALIIGNEKLQCFCGDREELPVLALRAIQIQRSSLPMEYHRPAPRIAIQKRNVMPESNRSGNFFIHWEETKEFIIYQIARRMAGFNYNNKRY